MSRRLGRGGAVTRFCCHQITRKARFFAAPTSLIMQSESVFCVLLRARETIPAQPAAPYSPNPTNVSVTSSAALTSCEIAQPV